MDRARLTVVLLSVLVGTLVACAAEPHRSAVTIRQANGTSGEQAAQAQLERLLADPRLQPWLFTREIWIDERSWIPHSHPVLTLNTRYLANDDAQLATLLHEQFHWYADANSDRIAAAVARFAERYPDAPSGGRDGAMDRHSTLVHLVICDLELQALTALRGQARARQVLGAWQHYRWIYDKVLNDPAVRRMNAEAQLLVP